MQIRLIRFNSAEGHITARVDVNGRSMLFAQPLHDGLLDSRDSRVRVQSALNNLELAILAAKAGQDKPGTGI